MPCLGRGTRWPPVVVPEAAPARFEPGRLRESSPSIFLRMAYIFGGRAGCVSVQLPRQTADIDAVLRATGVARNARRVYHSSPNYCADPPCRVSLPPPVCLQSLRAGCAAHSTVQRARRESLTSSRLDWRLRVSASPSELAGGVLGTVLVVER